MKKTRWNRPRRKSWPRPITSRKSSERSCSWLKCVKIYPKATDNAEHYQMARHETRIGDTGLPNKRGNTINHAPKVAPCYRRFGRVNP